MTERVWVLADPRAGTASQALGIAERLAEPFRTLDLRWGGLAGLPLPVATLAGLDMTARAAFVAPWPRLAISAGRRSAPVARWLAKRGVRTVHCMRAWPAGGLDLLVIGRHDNPRESPNILPILGATHRVSPARLAAARAEWWALRVLPQPRVALLVGGPVRAEGMQPRVAAALAEQVALFAGSVLATTSRRTGTDATEALSAALERVPHRLHRWGGDGANPLLGFLAWADIIVVTGDSISMIAESLADQRAHLHRRERQSGKAPPRVAREPLRRWPCVAAGACARTARTHRAGRNRPGRHRDHRARVACVTNSSPGLIVAAASRRCGFRC